jgi:hypothetical protein
VYDSRIYIIINIVPSVVLDLFSRTPVILIKKRGAEEVKRFILSLNKDKSSFQKPVPNQQHRISKQQRTGCGKAFIIKSLQINFFALDLKNFDGKKTGRM